MTSIRTLFTELVGTKYPIVQAGMSWISSCSSLPLAVSEAGGLGVVAAGPMRIHDLETVIREMRDGTDRPWAINLPLYRKGIDDAIDLLLDAPPPVIIASQGPPRRYLADFQGAGTLCFHVVASLEHARKAAAEGVDGLVVVGGEAGGHPPASGVSTAVITRLIARELPDVPLISSGGHADGYGLASAIALGASAAQFGTRFIATPQARVHPDYRERVLEASVDDAVTVGRGLGMIRALRNQFTDTMTDLEESGAAIDVRREAFEAAVLRAAVINGDIENGKLEAGQSAGLVDSLVDAGDLVRSIADEYHSVVAALAATRAPGVALADG